MRSKQPILTTYAGQRERKFVCSAVAIQAIIVNEAEEILLLSSPTKYQDGAWQIVSGALEAGETVLAGALRETREEAGEDVRVRPLGLVHAQTFHYDENVPYMIGLYYLMAYEGGPVQPGDDMAGSEYRWWRLDELADERLKFRPSTHRWMLKRAIELYRLWQDQDVPLQPAL